jgi:hypothetical protein
MSSWDATVRKALQGMDVDAVLAHLGKANHVKRPGERWRQLVRELIPSPEILIAMLRPFTPGGRLLPGAAEASVAFGALWAALEVPSPPLQGVIAELVTWCQQQAGASHQVAYVAVQVLGLWEGEGARAALERFRDDPKLKSLLPGIKAGLRKHGA